MARLNDMDLDGETGARGQEAAELIPLEEQVEAARAQGSRHAGRSRQKLYGGYKARVLMDDLAATIAKAAPLYVFGSPAVLKNPAVAFNAKVRAKGFDDTEYGDYNRMLDTANALAPLWRDKHEAAPEDLAEAALIHTVLADDELRLEATRRCKEWVEKELRALRQDPS